MTGQLILSIGEAMVELSEAGQPGNWRPQTDSSQAHREVLLLTQSKNLSGRADQAMSWQFFMTMDAHTSIRCTTTNG